MADIIDLDDYRKRLGLSMHMEHVQDQKLISRSVSLAISEEGQKFLEDFMKKENDSFKL